MTDATTNQSPDHQIAKSPNTALLAARDLHKCYRIGGQDLQVLRGVDVSVSSGEWLAILGASGSGKSTLLHLMGGLDRPDKGSVQFNGQEVFALRGGALDRYRNGHVGFVFQFYHLLPELSALDNVLIPAMIGKSMFAWPTVKSNLRKHAAELLQQVGLGERLKHRPNKLSGGERQRVAIARALMNKPAVLLADEPTGNLDAETGKQILDVLKDLHRRGQTIIMVTHDSRIADAADRNLTLQHGKLQA